jgi:hypothetical protein
VVAEAREVVDEGLINFVLHQSQLGHVLHSYNIWEKSINKGAEGVQQTPALILPALFQVSATVAKAIVREGLARRATDEYARTSCRVPRRNLLRGKVSNAFLDKPNRLIVVLVRKTAGRIIVDANGDLDPSAEEPLGLASSATEQVDGYDPAFGPQACFPCFFLLHPTARILERSKAAIEGKILADADTTSRA